MQEQTIKIADSVDYGSGQLLDITNPEFPIQILVSAKGDRIWVNVGPTCVLRICRNTKDISIEDMRREK